ncbi:Tad domain-containing protein [candidate division CSSED10-310 bacterium]|uniref:Tad domain-containing protein n=1 Tax=candidate division CSSED10-310 bacterium TaxID=2855610 RepID=A0ABV6YX87_UNCC1
MNNNQSFSNERGQVMMFGMFIVLVMFLFIGLIFNTGVVIMQKMQMQNAVDAAVLSGAVMQARGLTYIAYENKEISRIYTDGLGTSFWHSPFDSKDDGQQYVLDTFPPDIEDCMNNIDYINRTYPGRATALASQVANMNVPGASFTPILPGHNSTRLTDFRVHRNKIYFWYEVLGFFPILGSQRIDTFIEKDKNTITYFAGKLTGLGAGSGQLMSGGWFGTVPPITTYAAAKPYGGWILSPLRINLEFIGVEVPIWMDWELPIVGNLLNLLDHDAYLIRIGDRRLHPRPTLIPNHSSFQH